MCDILVLGDCMVVFEEIKSPIELLKYMENNIEYGICDKNGNKYRESDENFNKVCDKLWQLSSPLNLMKIKIGICFDQVELEREWFKRNNYNFKTIFIMFFNTSLPTHTFLAYEEKGKWYWFEHSDFNNRGIHEFDTYEDLINFQKVKHIEYVSRFCPINDLLMESLHIIEYDAPKYGSNYLKFINHIVNNGKYIINKEE